MKRQPSLDAQIACAVERLHTRHTALRRSRAAVQARVQQLMCVPAVVGLAVSAILFWYKRRHRPTK